MEKQIEVELMGNLTKEKFLELRSLFGKEGVFKKDKRRLSLMYFRDRIPKDLIEIKDELVDLRLRITNSTPEIIIKYGLFTGSHAREEISINFDIKDFEKYINLLKYLGWHLAVIYSTKTYVYDYKGIEFSLVEIKDYGYNFEAEIITEIEKSEDAKRKLTAFCEEIGLKPFNESELDKQCNGINNKRELQFDFNKQSSNKIREQFKEFF